MKPTEPARGPRTKPTSTSEGALAIDMEVGELIKAFAGAGSVLARFGIDFNRADGATLSVACQAEAVDAAEVWAELVTVASRGAGNWALMDQLELAEHIETAHHNPLRARLPVLLQHMAEVIESHGDRHRDLTNVSATLSELAREVTSHIDHEERTIFPIVRAHAIGTSPSLLDGTAELVAKLDGDHERIRQLLSRLRASTSQYRSPPDADDRYAELFAELERLESDLHMHTFKESHVMFRTLTSPGTHADTARNHAADGPD